MQNCLYRSTAARPGIVLIYRLGTRDCNRDRFAGAVPLVFPVLPVRSQTCENAGDKQQRSVSCKEWRRMILGLMEQCTVIVHCSDFIGWVLFHRLFDLISVTFSGFI